MVVVSSLNVMTWFRIVAGEPVMRGRHLVGLTLVSVLALTYYSGLSAVAKAPNASPARPPPSVSKKFLPSRMAALGDSVTAGFLTCLHRTCPANSWSTGTSISSHYERIRALNPKMTGHARNFAELGAYSWALEDQATAAVRFKAEYVTILIGANDACTRRAQDMTSVRVFRNDIDVALDELKEGLPQARILVVSIPDIYRLWQLGRQSDFAVLTWKMFPGCKSMLANPRSDAPSDNRRRRQVAARINAYNGELAAACRVYGEHCRWDGGKVHQLPVSMNLVDTVDHFHPNRKGQAKLADATYPGDFDW
jgi:lysophospholipase L1-like esterase